MSYHNLLCAIMVLALSSQVSHAGEYAVYAANQRAIAAAQAARAAADQRARDENHRRMQAQWAAERARAAAAQKKK